MEPRVPVAAHLPARGLLNRENSVLFVAAIKITLSAFLGTSGRVSKYVDGICNLLSKCMVWFGELVLSGKVRQHPQVNLE